MNIISTMILLMQLQDPAAAMATGDQNRPAIVSRTEDVIKTHSGDATDKSSS